MKANFDIIGVIPARYASERLSVKLLRPLQGKTLLHWSWENARASHSLDKLVIACDHPDLEKEAKKIGAEVILTSDQQPSGTDRIAEAVRDIEAKIIINIQADEPLLHPSIIDNLAQEMLANPELVMATAKTKIIDPEQIVDPNVVKVISDSHDFAVYFSRSAIPYYRNQTMAKTYYKHLGIYAYTKDFLYTFKNLPDSQLEKSEKLEQLRALEAGYKIKVLETTFDSCGVDVEDDLQKVEQILARKT
jgi:3-deoxy-manno-octulosonate cytidylyltransferase (CMP-KDO synthetase)